MPIHQCTLPAKLNLLRAGWAPERRRLLYGGLSNPQWGKAPRVRTLTEVRSCC